MFVFDFTFDLRWTLHVDFVFDVTDSESEARSRICLSCILRFRIGVDMHRYFWSTVIFARRLIFDVIDSEADTWSWRFRMWASLDHWSSFLPLSYCINMAQLWRFWLRFGIIVVSSLGGPSARLARINVRCGLLWRILFHLQKLWNIERISALYL